VPARLPAAAAFRAAVPADAADVVAFVNAAYRGESSRAGWTTEADLLGGQRTDVAEITAFIEAPDAELLLLVDSVSGDLLACCQLVRRGGDLVRKGGDGAGGGGGVHLGMVAVRPRRQGAGVGTALLAEAERRACGWGAGWIEMDVIVQRAELIAWYGRRGYQPTGQTRPFPYGEPRFGLPLRPDLAFAVLVKHL
jgi:GNAT superfamily N-acetyltransferase